jgi:hypothetical protein
MNKVITIIMIIGAIFSVLLASQIIKECNGQKPRIEKLESPSSINNPFTKDCITDINIFMRKDFSGEYCYHDYVNFENGNMKGEQKCEGESLEDVYNQIYQFCEGL